MKFDIAQRSAMILRQIHTNFRGKAFRQSFYEPSDFGPVEIEQLRELIGERHWNCSVFRVVILSGLTLLERVYFKSPFM